MAELTVGASTEAPNFEGWTCPVPLRDSPTIVMGHGGGGAMSAELIEHLFLPALASEPGVGEAPDALGDSAVLELGGARIAFSTDSFVVNPLVFPGGSIGDLAVNGTVNDLAMSGAVPSYLSVGFILEEGVSLSVVGEVAERLGAAAREAGVRVVTGDTKVVESGHGDGIFINTAGIGVVPADVHIGPDRAEVGDVVIVSGDIGVHGVAVMSVREGLRFGTEVVSDCAPLNGLVATMLETTKDIHALRDPTRGGLGTSLNEIATASKVGVSIVERDLPVPQVVVNACAFLGLDPLYVANEGKLVAFVPPEHADGVLTAMRAHPLGANAAVIGTCVAEHPGMVVARTGFGATRVVDVPIGEQLPGSVEVGVKFLVLWSIDLGLLSQAMVRAIARMPDYGRGLEEQGKVLARYHVVGAHGGAWIYEVDSHEELERLLAVAPVFNFSHYDIRPLADMTEEALVAGARRGPHVV